MSAVVVNNDLGISKNVFCKFQTVYCPIDTSLSYSQANKLIAELKPTHLLLADRYTHPVAHRNDLVIEAVSIMNCILALALFKVMLKFWKYCTNKNASFEFSKKKRLISFSLHIGGSAY